MRCQFTSEEVDNLLDGILGRKRDKRKEREIDEEN